MNLDQVVPGNTFASGREKNDVSETRGKVVNFSSQFAVTKYDVEVLDALACQIKYGCNHGASKKLKDKIKDRDISIIDESVEAYFQKRCSGTLATTGDEKAVLMMSSEEHEVLKKLHSLEAEKADPPERSAYETCHVYINGVLQGYLLKSDEDVSRSEEVSSHEQLSVNEKPELKRTNTELLEDEPPSKR